MGRNFGPYAEDALGEKLVNIPEEEMKSYHKNRVRKIRYLYFLSVFCGIVAVISYFVFANFWIPSIIAIIGLIIFRTAIYQRNKWRRVYENLVYLRKKTLKSKQSIEEEKSKKNKKYQNLGSKKTKIH